MVMNKQRTKMEIEKDVPLPNFHRGGFYRYPWDDMKIGESFLVTDRKITTMSSLAGRAGSRLGYRFSCRSTDEGIRVWRVE